MDSLKLVFYRLNISYVSQIYKYSGTLSKYAANFAIDESYFKAILAKFWFESKDFLRDMRVFSENKRKVCFPRGFLAEFLFIRRNIFCPYL